MGGLEDLGGEHLVDILACAVIMDNRAAILEGDVRFRFPRTRTFPDWDRIYAPGQAAHANFAALCARLRPLWHTKELAWEDDEMGDSTFAVNLDSASGQTVSLTLKVDKERLLDVLKQEIRKGVEEFFAMAARQPRPAGAKMHVLLAGNSCRSPLTREVFAEREQEISESYLVHDQLLDGDQPDGLRDAAWNEEDGDPARRITPKTCVAFGLLDVLRTGDVGIRGVTSGGTTPFPFAVGRFARGSFQPVLVRNAEYGKWVPLGRNVPVPDDGLCSIELACSTAARAMEPGGLSKDDEDDYFRLQVTWESGQAGKPVFLRASGPEEIEVAVGSGSGGRPAEGMAQKISLK